MSIEPPVPVKERMTALDTLAVARELRGLVGGRVDKVFDSEPSGFVFVFRVPGAGRREVHVESGRFVTVGVAGVERSGELGAFSRELRRLLTGSQLVEVQDPEGERFVELRLRRPDVEGPLVLAIELFGHGNIVVARGGTLAAVEHARRWAHRTVRIGAEYERPPSRGNPLALSVASISAELGDSRTDLASTLAARLALGGPLAEEVLTRAGVPGNRPASSVSAEESGRLAEALRTLVGDVVDPPTGYLYRVGSVIVDVGPAPLERWRRAEGVAEESRPTFSQALAEFFAGLPARAAEDAARAVDPVRAELERQLARQTTAVEGLETAAQALRVQGEAILEHYEAAERAVAGAASDSPDGRIEVNLGGVPVTLDTGRPVRESANALFEEAKRLKGKLDGARVALAETSLRLQGHSTGPGTGASSPGSAATQPARRAMRWFEKFRWFISSEGILVIGGRDAISNDLIVRRYLREGDVYLHADIHGAPSVIVKHPPPGQPGAGEATLREAAQFGFCFSKAWRAGLASGSAFWVTPDQVSKSGASGEFVARGAWVIHGTKNVVRDVPSELGVGTVDYEGERLWCVAPPSALRSRGDLKVLLGPGEERLRSEREVELSRELGVDRGRLQSLLPAGGIEVRRA